jgi:hypothetical protein
MKAAFSTWNTRIAPVFDTACQIYVVEAESGGVVREAEATLSDDLPVQKVKGLVGTGREDAGVRRHLLAAARDGDGRRHPSDSVRRRPRQRGGAVLACWHGGTGGLRDAWLRRPSWAMERSRARQRIGTDIRALWERVRNEIA